MICMKKTTLGLLSALTIFGCNPNSENDKPEEYSIKGTLTNADSSWVILQKRAEGQWVKVDSAQVLDGAFSLKNGSLEISEMHYLKIGNKRRFTPVFLENSATDQNASPILKIGKYIPTTRPPITTPRNDIIIGSIIEVMASTALSTSSS